ncbi:MAG: GNAT family N-acetyltransferase [Bacteroidota bacterium]
MSAYLFTSKRLGFRNWKEEDKTPFYQMNCDKNVMKHFPGKLSREESDQLLERLQNHFTTYQYTYFAVEELAGNNLIGFIGLKNQDYHYQFTPFVDIGWRLSPEFWGKGYATEGAKTCLDYAFHQLMLTEIYSVAVVRNKNSFRVMEKIGMRKIDTFIHPSMASDHPLQPCVCYKIENESTQPSL